MSYEALKMGQFLSGLVAVYAFGVCCFRLGRWAERNS
jgi:hypothetical protein